jgi:multiple sugar transport system permease protein
MALTTTLPVTPAAAKPARAVKNRGNLRRSPTATVLLLLGAAYCLFPVLWVLIASTKSAGELFSTLTLSPSTHLFDNVRTLSDYRGGLYWRWMLNSALYAGVGGAVSMLVSAMAGFALAKYTFPGKSAIFNLILAGVLVPGCCWRCRNICCWPRSG